MQRLRVSETSTDHGPVGASQKSVGKNAKSRPGKSITLTPFRENRTDTQSRSCPVVRTGKLCIEVDPTSRIAFISERLCIGCGICPKKCPFDAINIINLPTNLETQVTHRYSANSFKLHRLPMPRPGQVLGLVGTNGIGKSTALRVLAGKMKPNLGRYNNPPDWEELLKHFRGSELQSMIDSIPIKESYADEKQTTSPRSSRTTLRPSPSRSMSTRSRKPSKAPIAKLAFSSSLAAKSAKNDSKNSPMSSSSSKSGTATSTFSPAVNCSVSPLPWSA